MMGSLSSARIIPLWILVYTSHWRTILSTKDLPQAIKYMLTYHQVPDSATIKGKSKRYIPYALCLISASPIYEIHKTLLKKLGSLLSERIAGYTNEKYTAEFYLSVMFHHLFLSMDDSIGVIITFNKSPFVSYRNGMNAPMSLENLSYGMLIQKIPIKNLIELLKLVLLERKIILVGEGSGEIGNIIECILCLLHPIL